MSEIKTYSFYANNKWHKPSSGKYFESEDPSIGKVWAKLPDCNLEDINIAVSSAKQAFYNGPWSKMHPAERGRILNRIGDTIAKNADSIGQIETKDNGKLPKNITPSLTSWQTESFYYYAGMCDKFEGRLIPSEVPNMHNYLKWEPFGVVALILPWNSPIGTLIWKLAPALAAGNTVVIKPSERASCSSLELMSALEEADLPKGLINVVTGFGKTTGAPLIEHDDIRMISFTGGTKGGSAASLSASKKVKPIIMELGGKSPQIIFKDVDLNLSVNGVVSGIFPVTGHSCISGSRILVHKDIKDKFTKKLLEVVKKAKAGKPSDPSSQIGPIANKEQYEFILEKINSAEKRGLKLLIDGRKEQKSEGYYIGPTIFDNVPNNDDLAQNEVFGPVASIQSWDNEDDVINIANDSIYGLAAGIWTKDINKAIRLADRIEAGTVYINNYFNASTQSPVGGYKQSGYGRENGWEGMRCYMQTKSTWLSVKPDQPDPF